MSNVPFAAQMEELAAYMASKISVPTIGIGGGYAPIGTINFFDATTAPQDWLACDGSVHNIADYPQLAEWYATQHGAANFYGGNGTTTFAVPDLQGEFLRGTGTNSHTNQGSGAAVGVHQNATVMPEYASLGNGNFIFVRSNSRTGSGYLVVGNEDSQYLSGAGTLHNNSVATTSSATSATSDVFTARPTNTSFLICVKAVVAGEVYSTEEREGGTWIDGRKWYYKTFNCGSMPNNTVKLISAGIGVNVVDNVISMEGAIKGGSGGFQSYNLPTTRNDGTDIVVRYVSSTDKIELITTDNWSGYSGYITMKYQKTT